jgi:hypothetical protein
MKNPGRQIAVILLLTLALAAVGAAQKRNKKYRDGDLAGVACEVVVVDDHGIIQGGNIKRPAGAFLLAIMNRRGDRTEHFSVTLDSAGAPEIYSLDTTPERWHGAVLLDLDSGQYRLRLKNSPDVSTGIQIQ